LEHADKSRLIRIWLNGNIPEFSMPISRVPYNVLTHVYLSAQSILNIKETMAKTRTIFQR